MTRICRAVVRLAEQPDLSSSDVRAIVGQPAFPGGGRASGDTAAVLAGEPAEYLLTGITDVRDGQLQVVGLPPPRGADVNDLIAQAHALGRFAFDCGSPDALAVRIGDAESEGLDSLAEVVGAIPVMSSTVRVTLGANCGFEREHPRCAEVGGVAPIGFV